MHPKYVNRLVQDGDFTHIPTVPQRQATEQSPLWQHESANYDVESSLPSLSLMISETPTHSPIDAIATRPTLLVEQASSTSDHNGPGEPLVGSVQGATAREARAKTTARLQATTTALVTYQSSKLPPRGRSRNLNPLDQVRWWLLHPGRIEFMLWLCGTVLLIGVTCLLLLVTAFSFDWIAPGQHSGMVPQSATNPVSTVDPVLTLIDHGPYSLGQAVHLHGQGFSIRGRIIFTFDSTQLSQNVVSEASSQPEVIADGHGEFIASLTLGDGQAWKVGRHVIVAHDITTNHLATLPVSIVANRATPVPTTNTGNQVGPTAPTLPTPGITVTPPARSTPAPPSPTATPTTVPTPTSTPKPTPTSTPKPTPTSTPKPTPTATKTPVVSPTATKGTSKTSLIADSGSSSLSADLIDVQDHCRLASHQCSMMTLASHTWILVLAYMLALIMLIIAGVLRSACR